MNKKDNHKFICTCAGCTIVQANPKETDKEITKRVIEEFPHEEYGDIHGAFCKEDIYYWLEQEPK